MWPRERERERERETELFSVFLLAGSAAEAFYWLFLWNLHQPFPMAQPQCKMASHQALGQGLLFKGYLGKLRGYLTAVCLFHSIFAFSLIPKREPNGNKENPFIFNRAERPWKDAFSSPCTCPFCSPYCCGRLLARTPMPTRSKIGGIIENDRCFFLWSSKRITRKIL